MKEYTKAITERGIVYSGGDGPVVHFPDDPLFEPLIAAMDGFIPKANEAGRVMRSEALPSQLQIIAAPLAAAANVVRKDATNAAREYQERLAGAMVPTETVREAAQRFGPEVRGVTRDAGPAEQIAFINRASSVEIAALLEADGALSNLHPQALDLARERALMLFHIDRTALAGRYPNAPSVSKIIATGTDAAATQSAAEMAVAALRARGEAVKGAEGVMQGVVGFIAAATATHPADALSRVLAA